MRSMTQGLLVSCRVGMTILIPIRAEAKGACGDEVEEWARATVRLGGNGFQYCHCRSARTPDYEPAPMCCLDGCRWPAVASHLRPTPQ